MDEIRKIIEEMKKEKDIAFEICDFGISNTLEYFIKKLENTINS